MVTIYLRYVLNTAKLAEFEHYGKLWIPLVEKFGGQHHGYFLPSEGANNIALALFTFDSLAAWQPTRFIGNAHLRMLIARRPSNMRQIRNASSAMSAAFSGRYLADLHGPLN